MIIERHDTSFLELGWVTPGQAEGDLEIVEESLRLHEKDVVVGSESRKPGLWEKYAPLVSRRRGLNYTSRRRWIVWPLALLGLWVLAHSRARAVRYK